MSQPRLARSSNEFIISDHAYKRMHERVIYHPSNADNLRTPEKKAKKKIRESCRSKSYNNSYVYWIESLYKKPRAVYVCKPTGIGKYVVLTAFWLK